MRMRPTRSHLLLFALSAWVSAAATAQAGVPDALYAPPPAVLVGTSPAQSPTILRLSIHEALVGALTRAVIIQTQRLDLQQQEAQTEQASHEFLPQTTVSGGLERDRGSATDVVTTQGTATSASLVSTWKLRSGTQVAVSGERQASPTGSLDSGGSLNTSSHIMSLSITHPLLRGSGSDVVLLNEHRAALALEIARKSSLQTQRDVVLSGVDAYFGLEQARQNTTLAEAALKRATDARAINEALLTAGRIAAIAMLQSDADVAQAELAVIQARQTESVACRQLLRVIGRDDLNADQTTVTLTDSFVSYLPPEIQSEGPIMQDALARRVDLGLAAAAVTASQFGVVAANDGMRNQLDLYVRLDRSGSSMSGVRTRQVNLAVGLSYTIPLDQSLSRLALSAARVDLKKADLARADLEWTARGEVSDALKNIQFAFLQYRMAQRTAQLARHRLDAEVDKARAGRSSATDLSLAQDTLNQALFQEAQARFAIFTAQLALQRSTGTMLEQWHMDSPAQDTALPL